MGGSTSAIAAFKTLRVTAAFRLATPAHHHPPSIPSLPWRPNLQLYSQGSLEGERRVLIDPNTLSEDGTVALGGAAFSEDGTLYGAGRSKQGETAGLAACTFYACLQYHECRHVTRTSAPLPQPGLPLPPTPPLPACSLHAEQRRLRLEDHPHQAHRPGDGGDHGYGGAGPGSRQ